MKKLIKYAVVSLSVAIAIYMALLISTAPKAQKIKGGYGLERVNCWFQKPFWKVTTHCFYMHVPENHDGASKRIIKFPVVYFQSLNLLSRSNPVLHLGGGGPGGSMYLDDDSSVKTIKEYHDDFSLRLGRDLVVIDPRGAGLSVPSFGCNRFVVNQALRFEENITLSESIRLQDKDYKECISDAIQQGYDLSQYHSSAVLADIALLRLALDVQQWVLFGVSYGTVYAQLLATYTPAVVESMILDSATFLHILEHEYYRNSMLGGYNALFNYCSFDESCEIPMVDIEEKIWGIYRKLQQDPVLIQVEHPSESRKLSVVLNGHRFMATLNNSVYGYEIFKELPEIIRSADRLDFQLLVPYVTSYIWFMLDDQWSDLSFYAHFCHEVVPFSDKKNIKDQLAFFPTGYLRDSAELYFGADDFCAEMQSLQGDAKLVEKKSIVTPTLFLHGDFDTITPLIDVKSARSLFEYSRLLTYPVSHSVMNATDCAEISAAIFVENPYALDIDCVR